MVGRKNITYLEIITNPQRLKLLGIISNKKYSIKQLQQISKINRGTLKHHLNILEEAKLIIKKREEKESGRPTYIIKNFIDLKEIVDEYPRMQSFIAGIVEVGIELSKEQNL